MQTARQYELIYIVTPESSEEMVTDLQTQVADVVSRFDAKIEKTENWGKRKLAYKNGQYSEANYHLANLQMETTGTVALDNNLRLADDVIRHLLIRLDD